jgi:inner membrane protein
MAQAGLRERTSLATATLVIGANLPDVDAVTYLLGESLQWRRGWTHGVLALMVLPVLLTLAMLAWDRLVRNRRLVRRHPPAAAGTLLWIAALAVATHPTLDYLNNYGLRWLMPFTNQWFYGDALFIVDPWVWAVLALGSAASAWASRRRPRPRRWTRPARIALGLVGGYAAVMFGLGQIGPAVAADALAARGIRVIRPPMVAPVLADATRRYVVADDGHRYYVAGFRWWPSPALETSSRIITHGATHPAVVAAKAAPETRGFLSWARFPFFTVEDLEGAYLVTMEDARYAPASGRSWAAVQVRIPKRQAGQHDTAIAMNDNEAEPAHRLRLSLLTALASGCRPG